MTAIKKKYLKHNSLKSNWIDKDKMKVKTLTYMDLKKFNIMSEVDA